MKFQVGDKVLVLHSEEEGEVVDIINNKMVMVEVKGVKFPAYTDQLDFPYFKRFSEKKTAPPPARPKKFIEEIPREKKSAASHIPTGIWIVVLPVTDTDEFGDEVVEALKIHLVNQTLYSYGFDYSLEYAGGQPGFSLSGQINPRQDFYLHDMPFENLNDSPAISVVFTLQPPDKQKASSFETQLKLKPKQVFARVQECRQKGEATFSYLLLDKYPGRPAEPVLEISPLLKKGYKVYPAASARQHLEPPKHELDLHIERLEKDHASLDPFEMLTLQMRTLEKYLDLAVAHRLSSMIVIHGVGTGRLRDEVHEVLRLRGDVKSFVNRYHPAYGYGATEVFFQY